MRLCVPQSGLQSENTRQIQLSINPATVTSGTIPIIIMNTVTIWLQ